MPLDQEALALEGTVLNASGYVVARRLATVSSKVTGRITEVLFEEGAVVREGQVLARLDPSTVNAEHVVASRSVEASRSGLREIEVRLAEDDVAALRARLAAARAEVGVAEGQLAVSQQLLDAYPDWRVPVRVIGIVPTADRQKATVRVRIAFEALDPRMLSDMGIKVRFLEDGDAAVARAVPTIPEGALLRDGAATAVWVVKDGHASRLPVKVGETLDGRVTVTEGVQPGETVVIAPPARLREGTAVELQAE